MPTPSSGTLATLGGPEVARRDRRHDHRERAPVSLVVQKYGGSSLSDADSIKRVARRIVDTKKAGNSVVVVVSGELGAASTAAAGSPRRWTTASPPSPWRASARNL